MKRLLLFSLFVFLMTPTAFAQPDSTGEVQQTGTLTVELTGFQSDSGVVRVGLMNSPEAYENDEPEFREAEAKIADRQAWVVFEDVPFGAYAVRTFHDENDNGELDTNFVGIPKEAYGFSNDARGRFGPPAYDAITFDLDQEELKLTIRVE